MNTNHIPQKIHDIATNRLGYQPPKTVTLPGHGKPLTEYYHPNGSSVLVYGSPETEEEQQALLRDLYRASGAALPPKGLKLTLIERLRAAMRPEIPRTSDDAKPKATLLRELLTEQLDTRPTSKTDALTRETAIDVLSRFLRKVGVNLARFDD